MFRRIVLVSGLTLALSCSASEPQAPPPRMALAPVASPARPPPVTEKEYGLNERQIRSVVEAEYARVRGCHTVEYSGQPESAGTISVDLSVMTNGTVSDVSLGDSSFDSDRLHDCVIQVTRSLRFPRAREDTDFTWVYKFEH